MHVLCLLYITLLHGFFIMLHVHYPIFCIHDQYTMMYSTVFTLCRVVEQATITRRYSTVRAHISNSKRD